MANSVGVAIDVKGEMGIDLDEAAREQVAEDRAAREAQDDALSPLEQQKADALAAEDAAGPKLVTD